jgi:hypothetical protein
LNRRRPAVRRVGDSDRRCGLGRHRAGQPRRHFRRRERRSQRARVRDTGILDPSTQAALRGRDLRGERLLHPEGLPADFQREKRAGRFRRKGLDRMSRRIADLLKAQQVTGRTLLEVGGSVGAIEIELIRAGIARAVNVELTSESDPESWNCRLRASRVSWDDGRNEAATHGFQTVVFRSVEGRFRIQSQGRSLTNRCFR